MSSQIFAWVSALFLLPVPLFAQPTGNTPAPGTHPAAGPAPRFSAAEVHPSPRMSEPWMDGPHLEGDRYVVYEATLAGLIANAYGIDEGNVVGGPSWLDNIRYDNVAKTAPATTSADQ